MFFITIRLQTSSTEGTFALQVSNLFSILINIILFKFIIIILNDRKKYKLIAVYS